MTETPPPDMAVSEGPRPYTLVAELTYRCPLRCVYCSNPLDFARHGDGLGTADWLRVFREAEDLGVVQLNLTGGEPLVRERTLLEAVASSLTEFFSPDLMTRRVLAWEKHYP